MDGFTLLHGNCIPKEDLLCSTGHSGPKYLSLSVGGVWERKAVCMRMVELL